MGKLWVISTKISTEYPIPHSACYAEFDNGPAKNKWYGFAPETHGQPIDNGKVYLDSEAHRLEWIAKFTVSDLDLEYAINTVVTAYSTKGYKGGVCDCVSF